MNARRRRWRIRAARALDRLPWVCWSDAMDWGIGTPEYTLRRALRPQRCPLKGGSCWCGKKRGGRT